MATAAEVQRRRLRGALARLRAGVDDLWLRYLGVGGTADPAEVQAFLDGAGTLSAAERDRLALVANELLVESAGRLRVPFERTVRDVEPPSGQVAAFVELMVRTHLAPPEALAPAVDVAAERLGVRAVVYLADYERVHLVPLPSEHGAARKPLRMEGTVAGRAFRLLELTAATAGGQPRLWVPIADGVTRIGVLDVMVDDRRELEDPVLRRQCWWLTHFIGHLVTSLDARGDGFDAVRRRRPRATQAELIYHMLPPRTAGTDRVLVSGRVEPTYGVGGDAFDYALSPTSAQFGVLDATGHDLAAGMVAATGLAAYRNARRNGLGLFEQAEFVNQTLEDQFYGKIFATGVLGDLDVRTGRLRYLVAGHPNPLLLRHGRVVKQLVAGRRPLLGLELRRSVTIGEELLEPDDMVAVYTDGITEARNGTEMFGLPRLIDILERETLHKVPLPEVVDRATRAVLRHQDGVLQDDATLFLLHWTRTAQEALEPGPPR
ncbi:PP2C family protein-serine/threonine phosphatase [Puerhibacterium puerhi]|uniref:PP2C family protein-serine/threonine phosphatase n=1 Tax=Puerhibacterium puerhi TaxID=2692623 RepID=UPI001356D078|nr:PP2C family protein-serine/threonine phosphatase [Puerhibacterium puerhi]